MDYILAGHSRSYEVVAAIQLFFPNEKYKLLEENELSDRYLLSSYENGLVTARFFVNGAEKCCASAEVVDGDISNSAKLSIYNMFSEYIGRKLPWGILTGIRPAKIVRSLMAEGFDDDEIISRMKARYLAAEEKIRLSMEVGRAEDEMLKGSYSEGYSMYVGVPFCPSRCLYCSFTSYPVEKYAKRTGEYVDKLISEMDSAVEMFKGKPLETLYIGGGTPTSLDDISFEKMLKALGERFDLSALREFSVEAGRPDTITPNKLDIMKAYGVGRISINPQTINDKTLETIGRKHNAKVFYEAYNAAVKKGFNHINIDLILGLDGEKAEDVRRTFEAVTKLDPGEITVHTLAVKRASRLKEELDSRTLADSALMEEFLSISKYFMDNFGYKPYYMYRQKNMLGNFENVGYAKPGYGGIYNVLIMEECQSIIAFGAGSVSKFVNPQTGRIERAFNLKSVEDYLARADEMNSRKIAAFNKAFS